MTDSLIGHEWRDEDEDYPTWICEACGKKHGRRVTTGAVASWHYDTCGVCGAKDVPVTEPRDYGHLKAGWEKERRV